MSGRTKIAEGTWLTIDDSAFELFRTDYHLPLIPPVPAAYAATTAEHLFPILTLQAFPLLNGRFAASVRRRRRYPGPPERLWEYDRQNELLSVFAGAE